MILMSWVRLLTILMTAGLLWGGLLGAGAGSAMHVHDHGQFQADQAPFVELVGTADECCQSTSERTSSCTSIVVVPLDHRIPSLFLEVGMIFRAQSVGLPDGRDLHDLLEPPRVI